MVKSVSLDNAVVAQIEKEAREEERPFSQIVNRRLRLAFGLALRKPADRCEGGALRPAVNAAGNANAAAADNDAGRDAGGERGMV